MLSEPWQLSGNCCNNELQELPLRRRRNIENDLRIRMRNSHEIFDSAAIGAKALSPEEKRSWLRLIRTPHIGGVTFFQLLAHFGTATEALDALPSFAKFGSRITAQAIPPPAKQPMPSLKRPKPPECSFSRWENPATRPFWRRSKFRLPLSTPKAWRASGIARQLAW